MTSSLLDYCIDRKQNLERFRMLTDFHLSEFQLLVWMENQPHYSGNTETAVGSHLGQSLGFFLLCLSTLTGLKKGKRD